MFPLSREEIEKICAELAPLLVGARIENVGIPSREEAKEGFYLGEVVLNLLNLKNKGALLIRLSAPAAIAYQTEKYPLAPAAGAGWMQGLKKYLIDKKIQHIASVQDDRALILSLSSSQETVDLWLGLFPVAPACAVAHEGKVVVTSDPKRFPLGSAWQIPKAAAKPGAIRPEIAEDPLPALLAAWHTLTPASKKTQASKKSPPKPKLGLRFTLPGDFELVVGRNAKENHEITFHLSRGRDLWLHLQGASGAHGIVFLKEGQSLPLEALAKAAEIVANRSLPRGWDVAEVTYALRKNVRPAPGGQPGRVLVREAKTLRIKSTK